MLLKMAIRFVAYVSSIILPINFITIFSTATYSSSVYQGPTDDNVALLQDFHMSASPPPQFQVTAVPMRPQVTYSHQPKGPNSSPNIQPNPTIN